MWNKRKVVMLPTEKSLTDSYNIYLTPENQLIRTNLAKKYLDKYKMQHLYILSDEPIKEGDWFLNTTNNTVHKCHTVAKNIQSGLNGGEYHGKFECKKVSTSTDKSLKLPEPSQAFIEAYVKAYNDEKPITDVMVEYEIKEEKVYDNLGGHPGGHWEGIPVLKVNKDNTITIRKVKYNWNRDEVVEILEKLAAEFSCSYGCFIGKEVPPSDVSKWIEENL